MAARVRGPTNATEFFFGKKYWEFFLMKVFLFYGTNSSKFEFFFQELG
jgi:hypothetical protein